MEKKSTVAKADQGIDLLQRILETSEKSITSNNLAIAAVDELKICVDKLNLEMKILKKKISEHEVKYTRQSDIEEERRFLFLKNFPRVTALKISPESERKLNDFEKYLKGSASLSNNSLKLLFLSLFIIGLSGFLAIRWYSASIRSKIEYRGELLSEIKAGGNVIISLDDYSMLRHNTEMMKTWIKKNPKDSEKFLRFKSGYDASLTK